MRIEFNRLISRVLDAARGLGLLLHSLERYPFSVADRGRELRLRVIRSERRRPLRIIQANASEPELFLARRGIDHQVSILPCDATQKTRVLRLQLFRRQIKTKSLRGLQF